jgi:5-methyltetrahydrofolate--homocysteine methyltransferase
MNEHVLVGQIANHIVKGKFETHLPPTMTSNKVPTGLSDLLQRSMEYKVPPPLVSTDALDKAMQDSIEKFKAGEFLLPDLIVRAVYTGKSRELLAEYASESDALSKGTAVLATINGKDYAYWNETVQVILKGLGYKIVNLGDELSANDILQALNDNIPDILWINAPSTSIPEFNAKPKANLKSEIKKVTDTVSKTGLRDQVTIMMGGIDGTCNNLPPVEELDADFFCGNVLKTVSYLKDLAYSAN